MQWEEDEDKRRAKVIQNEAQIRKLGKEGWQKRQGGETAEKKGGNGSEAHYGPEQP